MRAILERQAVRVAIDKDKTEPGLLIFVGGALVAVFSRLDQSIEHESKGQWYLEAGFGRCETAAPPLFASQDEAEEWVAQYYGTKK